MLRTLAIPIAAVVVVAIVTVVVLDRRRRKQAAEAPPRRNRRRPAGTRPEPTTPQSATLESTPPPVSWDETPARPTAAASVAEPVDGEAFASVDGPEFDEGSKNPSAMGHALDDFDLKG